MENHFWHVCYLQTKSEKVVLKKIEKLQIDVFLPLVKHRRVYKTTRKTTLLPLFPGYIFIWIAPGYRHHITAINEVYRFIKFKDEFAKISDEEINNLKLLIQNVKDNNDIFQELIFQVGKNVEIVQGPIKGMRGKIIRKHGKRRIVIEIKSISQSISIEVAPKDITGA